MKAGYDHNVLYSFESGPACDPLNFKNNFQIPRANL